MGKNRNLHYEKAILLFFFMLVLTNVVRALPITNTTIFVRDGVKYVIPEGVGVHNAATIHNGLLLDNGRLFTFIEGGEVSITFKEWNKEQRILVVNSSVPQTINFEWYYNNTQQYAKINNEFYTEGFQIKDTVVLTLVNEDKSSVKEHVITEHRPWLNKKLFFFVVNEKLFFITPLFLIIFVLILLFTILVGKK